MNTHFSSRASLASAGLLAVLASTADAQSLTRLQGAGGRQLDPSFAVVDRFLPGDHWALVTISDGIVPGDTNGWVNAGLLDLWTGGYSLLVTGIGGAQLDGDTATDKASANGNFVMFHTEATNLGWVDTNGCTDVCVLDRTSGTVQRASLAPGGVELDAWSAGGGISDDGRWALFSSEATNVIPGVTDGTESIFVRDMTTGAIELISVALSGGVGDAWSNCSDISADGRFVLFTSWASDLVPGDTNGNNDLFLRDRQLGTTTRLDVGPGGVQANGDIYYGATMTPDARWVLFDSTATNLLPNCNGLLELFLLDRQTSALSLQSVGAFHAQSDGYSYHSGISADGRTITFMSDANNLDLSDDNYWMDEFQRDVGLGVTRIISRSTAGVHGLPPLGYGPTHWTGALSPSGRLASFRSNLRGLVAGDTNLEDTFVYDAASPCAPIESYCVAKTNSLGCTPVITSSGEPYTTGASDAFFASAHSVRNSQPGIFIWSHVEAAAPFFGGTLCLAPPVWRTPGQSSAGSTVGNDCSGTYSFHFSQAYMAFKGIGPGTLLHGQFWSRDSGFASPNNVGLTGGLRFVTAP